MTKRLFALTFAASAFVGALAVPQASAASTTFTSVADSFVSKVGKETSKNFGKWTDMRADAANYNSYLRFSVSGISGTVSQALLRIYSKNASSIGYQVRGVSNTTWSETSITYSNAPAFSTTVTASSGPTAIGWTQVDITPLVTTNGSVNLAITSTDSKYVWLATKEAGANAPQLVVTTTTPSPSPSASPSPSPSPSASPSPTPPSVPGGLTANATSPTSVALSWSAAADDVAVAGYTVYRGGTPITTVGGTTTSYTDPTATASTSYAYTVDAFDGGGLHSAQSAPANVTTPAAPPTTKDTTVTAAADTFVSTKFPTTNFGTWDELRVDTGQRVSWLKFDINGLSGTVTKAVLKLYSNNSSSFGYRVHAATDTAWTETGLTQSSSDDWSPTVAGSSGPTAPGWTSADVTSLVTGNGLETFVLDSGDVNYLSLRSREQGSTGPQLVVTTSSSPPAAVPPSTPDGLTATASGPTQVNLRWNASTDDEAVVAYGIYRGGSLIAAVDGETESYSDRAVVASTTYTYTVDAVDNDGLRSSRSVPATVTTPATADTQAPTVPGNVRATVTSSTRVDVSWSASTDNVGVAGYTVYRNGSTLGSVGPAVTAFADTTVSSGSTYSYTVDAFDAAGNRSAKTSPVTASLGGDPVLAAAGDIACDPADPNFNGGQGVANYCRQMATSNILGSIQNLTAVLPIGDLQYEDGSQPSQWAAAYNPSWGRFRSITYPAIGNHEYYSGVSTQYFSYWGAVAGQPGKGWYSFNIGNWHIVVLSGECDWIGGCGSGSPMESWLRSDLAASNQPCTLAAWHEPRFTSGWSGPQPKYDALWRDLYAEGAEVILNAHDHVYERFAPMNPSGQADSNGIREFVVGTGGKNHSSFPNVAANSQVRNSDTFGVLALTLHSNGYDWKFLPEAGKVFTDSGSGTCSPAR